MRKIKLSELVVDLELYPRPSIDSTNVSAIVDSINAGATIPPILVDSITKVIVDGIHRYKAWLRLLGKDGEIVVAMRKFSGGAMQMYRKAMRLNVTHGKRLTPLDMVHCVHLGENFGLTVDDIAGDLCVPPHVLGDLAVARTATCHGHAVALKPALSKPWAGRKITVKQRDVNERMNANNARYFSDRLLDLLSVGVVDLTEPEMVKSLRSLQTVLKSVLSGHTVKKAAKKRAKRKTG